MQSSEPLRTLGSSASDDEHCDIKLTYSKYRD